MRVRFVLFGLLLAACAPAAQGPPPPANTPEGAILEAGQAWVRDGLSLELRVAGVEAQRFELAWRVENLTEDTVSLEYDLTRDVAIADAGGLLPAAPLGRPLEVLDYLTGPCQEKPLSLRPRGSYELHCRGSAYGYADSTMNGFVYARTAGLEVVVRVLGIEAFGGARWRVRLPR